MKRKRPPKITDLMGVISGCIEKGWYLDTRHASDRQAERNISRPEIIHVLKNGHREEKRDRYEESFAAWSYVVSGKTIDKKVLRVIVSFEREQLLIITAIDLKK